MRCIFESTSFPRVWESSTVNARLPNDAHEEPKQVRSPRTADRGMRQSSKPTASTGQRRIEYRAPRRSGCLKTTSDAIEANVRVPRQRKRSRSYRLQLPVSIRSNHIINARIPPNLALVRRLGPIPSDQGRDEQTHRSRRRLA